MNSTTLPTAWAWTDWSSAREPDGGLGCAVLARRLMLEQVSVLNMDLDGVVHQIEGGALQSLSWARQEHVGFDAQSITRSDWGSDLALRFNDDTPSERRQRCSKIG